MSILADAMAANTLGNNLTGIYSRAMRLSVPFEWLLRGNIGWLENWEITRREVIDWVHEHEPSVVAA
ncbi:MAG TPA: hypothetical protein VIN56_10870 [Candidatus Dormibacteraeota bacterium]